MPEIDDEMMQLMLDQLADQWNVPRFKRFNVVSGKFEVDDGLPDDFFDGDEEHEQPNDGGDWHDNPLFKAIVDNLNDKLLGKAITEYTVCAAQAIAKNTICEFICNGTITWEQVDNAEMRSLPLGGWHSARIDVPFIDPWPEKTVWTSIVKNLAEAAVDAGILVSGGCADGENINTIDYWEKVENGRFDVTVDEDWHDRLMAENRSSAIERLYESIRWTPGVREASICHEDDKFSAIEITVVCDEIANKRVIAESIYKHLPAGIGTKGDISEIIAVPNGEWREIRFNMEVMSSITRIHSEADKEFRERILMAVGGCGGTCESGGCSDGGECCSEDSESWLEDDGNSVLRCPQDCSHYKMLADYCNRGDRVVSRGRTIIDRDPCCRFGRR